MKTQSIITEKNGMYFFSVTSDGTTGKDWGGRITTHMNNYVYNHLKLLNTTNGVTSNLVLIKGDFFKKFAKESWIPNEKMQKFALENGFKSPSAEVSGLVYEVLADNDLYKKMKISVVTIMHEPINDLDGKPYIFCVQSNGENLYLEIANASPDAIRPEWQYYVFEVI
jgi:hypothetical protein